MDFSRFYKGATVIYMNREGCMWLVEWVVPLGHIFSDRTEVLVYSIEVVCGNNEVQFQSCDTAVITSVIGENGCTDIVSCQLQDMCSYQIWGNWPENSEIVKSQHYKICLPYTFDQFWFHQGRPAITVFVMHIGLAFTGFPEPSSDHNVESIHMAQMEIASEHAEIW